MKYQIKIYLRNGIPDLLKAKQTVTSFSKFFVA